jgi:hypothetical protein
VPQAGRPLEGSAPAPEPGGSTSKEPVGSELDPSPENQDALQQSTRPFPLSGGDSGSRRGSVGWEPRARDVVRPNRMPPRLHVVSASASSHTGGSRLIEVAAGSPMIQLGAAGLTELRRNRPQSPSSAREPQSRPRRRSACSPAMSGGASKRSGKPKQKSQSASSRLSQPRISSTSMVGCRHSCIHGRAGISTSATRPLVCAGPAHEPRPELAGSDDRRQHQPMIGTQLAGPLRRVRASSCPPRRSRGGAVAAGGSAGLRRRVGRES